MNSLQFSGTVGVWHYDVCESAADIYSLTPEQAIRALTFTATSMSGLGWTCMGTAEIKVTLIPAEVLQRDQLEALTDALEQMRAQHRAAEKLLEQQINHLKAKELEPA